MASPKNKLRGKGGEGKVPGSPNKNLAEKMSRWTKNKKTKLHGDSWDPDGKLFYDKVRRALKEIPVSDWNDVWDEFWFKEKENHMSDRRKKAAKKGR